MATPQEQPLTIQTSIYHNYGSIIVIGSNHLYAKSSNDSCYWIVILDRLDLSVKENFTFTDNSAIPSQLNPYLGNTRFIMILNTQNLASNNLPQGKLYDFLISEGAGSALNKAEQVFEALNCGTFGAMGYTLTAVLGRDGTPGFEFMEFINGVMVNTLHLDPVKVENEYWYTPIVH